MIIARYKETEPEVYQVELYAVLTSKGNVKIAEFECKGKKELKESTETADYVVKGGDNV
jgi:hypothetical protein